ncbi:hypothetical protein Tco_0473014 [Tanacetum coccineum]
MIISNTPSSSSFINHYQHPWHLLKLLFPKPPIDQKINIIPPKQLFVDLTQDDKKTPSPKLQLSSPSAPNAPSKTPLTKDTSSSLIDYIPKSPTSSTSLSPNGYFNPPTSPPPIRKLCTVFSAIKEFVDIVKKTLELGARGVEYGEKFSTYTIWRMRMKVLLGIHGVWDVVDSGSDDAKKNNIVKGLLFQSILEDLILQIGNLKTGKEMWEAIKTHNLWVDHVKEARLQTLITEFKNLNMLDNCTINEYATKLSGIASKSATL